MGIGSLPVFACEECILHFSDNAAAVLHAAASVGIERKQTTEQVIESYYRVLHADHRERRTRTGVVGTDPSPNQEKAQSE